MFRPFLCYNSFAEWGGGCMKTFLSKSLPIFTALVILCSVFALVPIQSFADDSISLTFYGGTPVVNYVGNPNRTDLHLIIRDTDLDSVVVNLSSSTDVPLSFSLPLNDHLYAIQFSYRWSGTFYYCGTCRYGTAGVSSYIDVSKVGASPSVVSNFNCFYSYSGGGSSSTYFYFQFDSSLIPTATPTPSPTPSPTSTSTPSIFDAFQPFRSFSGTYYNRELLVFPDSVTSNRYEQYSGIVANHDAMITDIRTNIDYYSDSIVYKFEYDLSYLDNYTSYDFSLLYDADQAFGYVYAYYTIDGQKYDVSVNQNTLSGSYVVCGCAPYPSSTGQLTPNLWEFRYDLVNQRAINLGPVLTVDSDVTITVIVSVDDFPYLPSGFDWSQFFQDTRPDNAFLYTLGGLAALPFFVSGLSFLALGALIGIILKFMR